MIEYFKRTLQKKYLERLNKFEVGCWVNIVEPTSEEIDYSVKNFGLDKRNLYSGLDINELPRLDFIKKNTYILTKIVPIVQKEDVETYLIIIGENFFLTLSKTEPSFIKKMKRGEIKFFTTQKTKNLITLLSLIDNNFQKLTLSIVKDVQNKARLRFDLKEKGLNHLLEQESLLNNLVSTYSRMNILYEKISRKLTFFEQDVEILENLKEESSEGLDLCKSSLFTISNIRNYQVILLSNKLNKIMSILTVFTIFLALPAAISGIYGMNIALPLQEKPLAFYYLLSTILAIWIMFVFYLKKKKII